MAKIIYRVEIEIDNLDEGADEFAEAFQDAINNDDFWSEALAGTDLPVQVLSACVLPA